MAQETDNRIAAAAHQLRGAARAAPRATWSAVRDGARLAGHTAGVMARHRQVRRAGTVCAVLVVSVAGVLLGVLLGGHTEADLGPFRSELTLAPSLGGDTTIDIPPLGALTLDSHDGPAHLGVRLGALDQARSEALLDHPNGFALAGRNAVFDVSQAVTRLGLRTLGAALLTSLVLAALVFRNARRVAWAGVLSLAMVLASLAMAIGTVRTDAVEEPQYEGLLVNAPAVVGDARRIANRYEEYSAQLQRLVSNVSQLYGTISTLPVYEPDPETIRVLHISDLHLNPAAWSVVRTVVSQFHIDMVIDTGDIVDWGSRPEESYVAPIGLLGVPYVYVRGNHDSPATTAAVARQRGAVVLDDAAREVAGLTVAGISDPLFTPDKEQLPPGSAQATRDLLAGAGQRLAERIRRHAAPVDIALVHDPAMAGPLAGTTPLVLAGHTHQRAISTLPRADGAPAGQPGTTLMVQGSTGGAGLRGLEHEDPLPLAMSVLYFGRADAGSDAGPDTGRPTLQGYDDISVGGTGLTEISLKRHIFTPPPVPPAPTGSPSPNGSPAPSPR